MLRYAAIYFAMLIVIGALDYLWLRVIARAWYEGGMAHLLAPQPNLYAAAAFYLLYPIGVLIFAVAPNEGDVGRAVLMGALFGLFAYGTYDLTNLAVLRDWPLPLTFIDMAWGTFISATGALVGAYAHRAVSG